MENKNDVKGGIVIEQLKRYARKIADHTGDSANAEIEVWFHPPKGSGDSSKYSVRVRAFDYANRKHIKPQFETYDLRDLGSVIDEELKRMDKKPTETKGKMFGKKISFVE